MLSWANQLLDVDVLIQLPVRKQNKKLIPQNVSVVL